MTPLRFSALLALALLATACARNKPATQEQLSRACQIIKCVCDKIDRSFTDMLKDRQTVDINWSEEGKPSCPEGFRLERKDPSSIYDRPLY